VTDESTGRDCGTGTERSTHGNSATSQGAKNHEHQVVYNAKLVPIGPMSESGARRLRLNLQACTLFAAAQRYTWAKSSTSMRKTHAPNRRRALPALVRFLHRAPRRVATSRSAALRSRHAASQGQLQLAVFTLQRETQLVRCVTAASLSFGVQAQSPAALQTRCAVEIEPRSRKQFCRPESCKHLFACPGCIRSPCSSWHAVAHEAPLR
jgi:hypothetical protein